MQSEVNNSSFAGRAFSLTTKRSNLMQTLHLVSV